MEGFDPKQQSQGVGDTIAKITNFFGIDKVAYAVAKLAGAPGCGCNERRQMLNELFPYETTVRKFKVLKNFNWNNEFYTADVIIEVSKKDTLHNNIIGFVRATDKNDKVYISYVEINELYQKRGLCKEMMKLFIQVLY